MIYWMYYVSSFSIIKKKGGGEKTRDNEPIPINVRNVLSSFGAKGARLVGDLRRSS